MKLIHNNYRKNNTCSDCGKDICDGAKRCRHCAGLIRQAGKKLPPNSVCVYCSKPFRVSPCQINQIRFCSKKCRKQYYTIPCANCGKEFKPTHRGRTKHQTCSIKCRGEMQSKLANARKAYICPNCGKKFVRYQSTTTNDNPCCSRNCRNEWYRGINHPLNESTQRECEICGDVFMALPSRIKNGRARYCSRECSSRAQIIPGTDSYRGENWNKQRKIARRKYGYRCQNCGIHEDDYGQALDVHHIRPFRDFGTERYKEANALANLVPLCKSCHMKVEKGSHEIIF